MFIVLPYGVCVFGGDGEGGLQSLWCLFYWPLEGRGTEHWIHKTTWPVVYVWMIVSNKAI